MVHTRHSFKESFASEERERNRAGRGRRSNRKNVDYQALVNGERSHKQPSKKRRHDGEISYIFDSRTDSATPHNHFTRRSSTARAKTSVCLSDTPGIEDSLLYTSDAREDLTSVAESYAEPRRSSRQRREVYGTLNETMLVRNAVADSAKTPQEKGGKQDDVDQQDAGDEEEDDDDEEDSDEEDDDEDDDDDDDESEEQEEDQGSQERPYSFRERRPTTRRYIAPPISGKSRRREAFYNAVPHSPMHKQRRHKMPQHSSAHKRKHYGSSTSSSGDSDDEHRFERRKSKSMAKARARCLPMNFNTGDIFGVLKDRERARDRQGIGSSLADVDPMSIDKRVTFESVGGLDKHIRSLKEMIVFPLLYPEVFEKFKIAPPRGVLFYGPPGTGKTLVARALANESSSEGHKVAFFMRKGADCLSKWVGESERQLRLLFDQAYSMRPSIIFFDEIDGLAPVRSTRQDQIHSSIVSTLLALMDGLDSRGEVVVIGATNRIDSIDPALRRPGRFDREFLFTLPNRIARRSIIEIHTKEWQPRLSKNFINELADQCVGYCGADIKALCTEAALIALRRRYPQIYSTNKKLVLDTDKIKITIKDFQYAVKKVVPASQRAVVSPGRALHRIMRPLLESTLESILQRIREFFPPANMVNDTAASSSGSVTSKGALIPGDICNDSSDDDDDRLPSIYEPLSYGRSTRATQRANTPPIEQHDFLDIIERAQLKKLSHRARFLITGREGMGQSTHLAPAVLHSMEHLKVYVLDLPSLFGVSARMPEEACSQIFTEARRTAPCIIYLPHVDVWWNSINETCRATFLTLLDDLPASLPVILIATSNTVFAELPCRVQDLFSLLYNEIFEINEPDENQRRMFFQDLFLKNAMEPPPAPKSTATARTLEVLPVAPPPPKRHLSDLELKNLREMEENTLRELRLFLRQIVWKLMADRKFKEFLKPVDLEEVPDYFQVIKEPMDLSTIMTKINSHKYISCKQFLKDVDLITNNCLEYNPDRDTYDRLLRNRACELRDTAHAMIYADLDPEFEKMCEDIHESRHKRDESEEIFAPSYIRVLQKNAHPMRASISAATSTPAASSVAPKSGAADASMERDKLPSSSQSRQAGTPERPTRQSRRLRGEESVEIPSFSSPIEKIIRSADGRRKRDREQKSDSSKSLDALKDSNENEKKAESKQDPSNDSEALVDGVEKLNETMEEDSAVVKEPNEAAAKNETFDEKPCQEESFVVMNHVEEKRAELDIEETGTKMDVSDRKDADMEVEIEGNGKDMAESKAHKKVDKSPTVYPMCLLLGEVPDQQVSNDEDAEKQTGNEMKSKRISDEKLAGVDSSSEMEIHKEIVVDSKDGAELELLSNQADEFIHKEALESLLTKLVNGTEFSNISSLEKTYFSINNLIHRNRKSTDKTILIEELDRFIIKLSEVQR